MGVFFNKEELSWLEYEERPGPAWLRKSGRPIYVYGGGRNLTRVREMLSGLDVRGVIDNNPALQGDTAAGLKVVSWDLFKKTVDLSGILVCISVREKSLMHEIALQCQEAGVDCFHWIDCWRLSFSCIKTANDLEDMDLLKRAHTIFEEQESRDVFRRLIRYHAFFDPDELIIEDGPQYFLPTIPNRFFAYFVDCGASSGDTLKVFRSWTNNQFQLYHAFEPSDRLTCLHMEAQNDPRVRIYALGLSDHHHIMRFTQKQGILTINPDGELEIETTRLDDVLGANKVSFIKMDIEGSEVAALKGAENIIRRERPVLAISAYHYFEHLWYIPLWIDNLNLNYQLLFRHYYPHTNEAICFAIPE